MFDAMCARLGVIHLASSFNQLAELSTQLLNQTTEARRETSYVEREAET
jgi:hypothetical protein